MKNTAEPFEELYIPRRDIGEQQAARYRVYSDAKHYKLVEAVSALDAIKSSGMVNIYKIERHNPMEENIIHINYAEKAPPSVIAEQEAKVADQEIEIENAPIQESLIEPAKEPEVAAATPASVGLSNEEVEKLINGN